jgi:predicted TPR repeat methyltransferase
MLPDLIKRALACVRDNDNAGAKTALLEILRIRDTESEAWYYLGVTHLRLDENSEGERCLRRAIALKDSLALAHYWLGIALSRQHCEDEAIACYERTVALDPAHHDAWLRAGRFHELQHATGEAERCYRRAIAVRPDSGEAHAKLAGLLHALGRADEARAEYHEALRLRPDMESVRYLLAALDQSVPPPAAPPGYVRALFDDYAEKFESHLTQQLAYRTPELLSGHLREFMGKPVRSLDIMDLGCGTGLCGVLFREHARRLVGVDLSPAMIEKARGRGIYDELLVEEVVAALGRMPGQFDLVLAGDVFVYIGDLKPVLLATRSALRPGGLFAFSVEAGAPGTDYAVHRAARYTHSAEYVRTVSMQTPFEELAQSTVELRKQEGVSVAGHLFVLRSQ